LFDIGADLQALENLLEESGGDISEAETEGAVSAWFDELHGDLGEKLDRYVGLIRNLESLAEMREAEIERMLKLARTDRNKASALKERLKLFFQMRGLARYDTPHFRLSLATNGGKVPLLLEVEAGDLPPQFQVTRTAIEADKEALRAALESGAVIEGARLGERGQSLRIR
jgi:hypothetical protein